MSLRRNFVANALGGAWTAAMSIAFLPIYIKYLGLEAYGLVGLFAMMTAWLALLDLGMGPALNREMARFTAGVHTPQSIADLVRTLEVVALAMALAVGVAIWAAASWVASDWLRAGDLSLSVVALAISIMGWVLGLRLIEGIYRSAAIGMQRHVWVNAVMAILATLRWAGAAVVLIWVSPTVEAFFLWQGLISLVTVVIFGIALHRALPVPERPARASVQSLRGILLFSGGMMSTMVLSLLLSHTDKLILSKVLPLEDFGRYVFAGTVAACVCQLVAPVSTAFFPRFSELVARNDEARLRRVYHAGCQLASVLLFPASLVLLFFGERLLRIWTGDSDLAEATAPLVAVLGAGFALNSIMQLPYMLQLAHGWSGFAARVNAVAVAVLVPALFWVAPRFGGLGAAWVWVVLNVGYVLIALPIMHRRLLPSEKWRWYFADTGAPLLAASAIGTCLLAVSPSPVNRFVDLGWLISCGMLMLIGAVSVTPLRKELRSVFLLLRTA